MAFIPIKSQLPRSIIISEPKFIKCWVVKARSHHPRDFSIRTVNSDHILNRRITMLKITLNLANLQICPVFVHKLEKMLLT
jgi:hypothetical protein